MSSFGDAPSVVKRASEQPIDLNELATKLGATTVAPIQFSFAPSQGTNERTRGTLVCCSERLRGAHNLVTCSCVGSDDFDKVFDGVCAGFSAYVAGDYEAATTQLLAVRGHTRVLGGTAVQHELVDLLLVEWCVLTLEWKALSVDVPCRSSDGLTLLCGALSCPFTSSASRCEDLTLARLLLNERYATCSASPLLCVRPRHSLTLFCCCSGAQSEPSVAERTGLERVLAHRRVDWRLVCAARCAEHELRPRTRSGREPDELDAVTRCLERRHRRHRHPHLHARSR